MHENSPVNLARWGAPEGDATECCFVLDGEKLPSELQNCNVVIDSGTGMRAEALLARGAARVLLADAAMLDSTVVSHLVHRYGSERIGVALVAKKRHVSWSLDTVSNADFRCLTPSVGKPGWEIVMSNGAASGTDAEWWLREMLALGASMALIRVDIEDDDLNLCAGLVEAHGNKLWFSPWQHPDADLEPWVRYGQIRQLLLPAPNIRDEN
ncbi:MAG: HisA/HisF-related TIM barrel protein, partial [Sideroxydans sp.]